MIIEKTFKECTKMELYTILKNRVDIFVVEQNCPYPEIDTVDLKAIHMYIQRDNTMKAYLRLFEKDPNTLQIGRVMALERHKGYASSLLEEAIVYARSHFYSSIYLEAQVYVVSLYEKKGFKVISRPFLEDGIEHVQMKKDL